MSYTDYTLFINEFQRSKTNFNETYAEYNGGYDSMYDADEMELTRFIKAVRIA